MVTRLLPVMLLVGCDEEVYASTQITSLQIVSMASEPPEVSPHESIDLIVTIADPHMSGAEVAVWMCTPVGDGGQCLESAAYDGQQPIATGVRDPDTHAAAIPFIPLDVQVAEINAVIDSGKPFWGTLAFALACKPGLCPLFDDIEAGTVNPDHLADPELLLAGLPMDGVSLGWRTMTLTSEDPDYRNDNPTITPMFDTPVEVAAGSSRDLSFQVDEMTGSGIAYPLTTVGGFSTESAPAPTPSLTWVAPEKGGQEGFIYVVVDDGFSGQSVWIGEAIVR